MHTIFLTGATGFVGSHLLRRLLEHPGVERVYALVRRAGSCPVRDNPRVVELVGTLEDVGHFGKELLESDYVFHLGARATYGAGTVYDEVNHAPVRELVRILEQGRRLKNLVFCSSIGAVDRAPDDRSTQPLTLASPPHPASDYGRSKLAAERVLQASRVPHTILRLTWIYGAGMRRDSHINVLLDLARARHPVCHVAWPGRVSVIHVDDAVRAMLACLDNPAAINQSYFAVTESPPMGEILATLWSACHGERPRQLPPPAVASAVSRFHAHLPLSVSNLFISYLWAEGGAFARDLLPGGSVPFATGVADVLGTRSHDGDWWAITGANSGIGLALAEQLLAKGHRVLLVDRDTSALASLPAGPTCVVVQADLGTDEGVAGVAREFNARRLRCIINNAGVGFKGSTLDVSEEQFHAMLAVNCNAPVMLVKQCLQRLVLEGTTIVNICSSVAYNPLPMMSLYAASKAFLLRWSLALAYELRKTNRVITFSPSGTRTAFQRNAGVKEDSGGLLRPEDVARRVLQAVHDGREHVVMGAQSRALLLVSRFLPDTASARLWGALFEASR